MEGLYIEQIKRELGAKLIYDTICPVAAKAFYGFDPYEKKNGSIAADGENSYLRCNQIAEAALKIENVIKKLSEQELENIDTVRTMLKECFEGMDNISSMTEGKCLDKLIESVMKLIREVYL